MPPGSRLRVVLAEFVESSVAGEVGEAWGGMVDGVVGLCGVDNDERGGHVDWAEGYLGFGLMGEDMEQVEA